MTERDPYDVLAREQIREEARAAGTPIGDHHKFEKLVAERVEKLVADATNSPSTGHKVAPRNPLTEPKRTDNR